MIIRSSNPTSSLSSWMCCVLVMGLVITKVKRMADVLFKKCDSAQREHMKQVVKNVMSVNSKARIIKCNSPVSGTLPSLFWQENGPTMTRGGLNSGAGSFVMQKSNGTASDPSHFAVVTTAKTFAKYPYCKGLLAAMGYSAQQVKDLAETIAKCCEVESVDVIVTGTPIDLGCSWLGQWYSNWW
jgi:predicted GTPase